jgi:hypothetical protein
VWFICGLLDAHKILGFFKIIYLFIYLFILGFQSGGFNF